LSGAIRKVKPLASQRLPHISPPDLPGAQASDASIDHALALLLGHEAEAALRWSAAALEMEPSTPGGLIVTSQLLGQMGRTGAAIGGLESAVDQAIVAGNLPMAIAAIDDLRTLGVDVKAHFDRVSSAFCQGSARLRSAQTPLPLPDVPGLRPLSPFLAGPALASKAAEIVKAAARAVEGSAELPPVTPLPFFSELSREALCDLLPVFETVTVAAGQQVLREGEVVSAAYVVARGEVEISRRMWQGENGASLVLARLGAGAFFGEMGFLFRMPCAASVVATRPSILLVARRETVEAIAARRPETAAGLAAHCRRQSVSNLGWGSPVLAAVPANERAVLVQMCEARVFSTGEKLIEAGKDAQGLHLIVSGEVGVVAFDGDERVALATLGAGETVGEVELVLCRRSISDAIATHPTATLFLPSDEFFTLMQDRPGILQALYAVAVRRHREACLALQSGRATMAGDRTVDGTVAGETWLESRPPAAAAPLDPPIVPVRIVSVGPTPTVGVQPSSTIAPTNPAVFPATRRRRATVQAFAGGAFAAVAGVLIALVALHGTPGGTPGSAVGAAVRTEVLPARIEPALPAADPSAMPSAGATATPNAPGVSRAAESPPAPPRVRTTLAAPAIAAVAPVKKATPATTVGASPTVAASATALPQTAAARRDPVAPTAAAVTDEFGGRQ